MRSVVMRRIHVIALSDIYQTKDTRKPSAIIYLLLTNFGDRGDTEVKVLVLQIGRSLAQSQVVSLDFSLT